MGICGSSVSQNKAKKEQYKDLESKPSDFEKDNNDTPKNSVFINTKQSKRIAIQNEKKMTFYQKKDYVVDHKVDNQKMTYRKSSTERSNQNKYRTGHNFQEVHDDSISKVRHRNSGDKQSLNPIEDNTNLVESSDIFGFHKRNYRRSKTESPSEFQPLKLNCFKSCKNDSYKKFSDSSSSNYKSSVIDDSAQHHFEAQRGKRLNYYSDIKSSVNNLKISKYHKNFNTKSGFDYMNSSGQDIIEEETKNQLEKSQLEKSQFYKSQLDKSQLDKSQFYKSQMNNDQDYISQITPTAYLKEKDGDSVGVYNQSLSDDNISNQTPTIQVKCKEGDIDNLITFRESIDISHQITFRNRDADDNEIKTDLKQKNPDVKFLVVHSGGGSNHSQKQGTNVSGDKVDKGYKKQATNTSKRSTSMRSNIKESIVLYNNFNKSIDWEGYMIMLDYEPSCRHGDSQEQSPKERC